MKPDLPPINVAPRKRVDLRSLQAPVAADDRVVEENSRRLASEWGAVTTVPRPKPAIASLRLEIPEYLDRQLAQAAFDRRVTKQFLVIQALQSAGFNVDPGDLVPDKRKRR
ncbi:MAG: hypothetical protein AB7F35_28610 [Acetobacteraceae bacterium]